MSLKSNLQAGHRPKATMPEPTRASLLKTLSVGNVLATFLLTKSTKIQAALGTSPPYPQINHAILASYLLYNLSEVENRFGNVKFLKWLSAQFLLTQVFGKMVPGFPGYEGLNWIIFGLVPVFYKLNWAPRSSIFNIVVMAGQFLTATWQQNLATTYAIFAGLTAEKITNSTSNNKPLNKFFTAIFNCCEKLLRLVPAYMNSLMTEPSQKPSFPFLATESWRRQDKLEKIEQAQMRLGRGMQFMQNQNNRFMQARANANPMANNLRQRPAPAPRPQVAVDAEKLATLKNMGFREDRAQFFLRQTNNDLEQATNFLLAEA